MCDRLTLGDFSIASLGDGIGGKFSRRLWCGVEKSIAPSTARLNPIKHCTSRAASTRTEAQIRGGLINTQLLTASISHHTLHTTMCTMMWNHYFRIKSDEENFFCFSIFPTHTIAHLAAFFLFSPFFSLKCIPFDEEFVDLCMIP